MDRGQDFAHFGFPTGFPLGPDCDQFAARLEWRPDPAWAWGVEALIVRDGAQQLGDAWVPGDDVPSQMTLTSPFEKDQRVSLTADWSPSPSITVSASAGLAKVQSLGNVYGTDADGAIGRLQAALRW